ncbi:MAG: DHA2 family efflux MFS transporter permease subunit [Acidimicrobiales bacterium]
MASPRVARRGYANPWLTLLAVALGVVMVGLDGTVVAIANPVIGRDLHATLSGLQWVTNGYLLCLAVLMITAGKLGDRYGRKRVFLAGVVGFALASLGSGLSASIGMLIAFRCLQGVAGALLMPSTLAILRGAFPPQRLEMAVGIWGGTSAVAIAAGPIVGGLLVQHVSWQSVFYINLLVGAVALAVGGWVVAESRDERPARSLDLPGVALLSGALFCLVWGIIRSQGHGWGSAQTIGFLAGAGALFVAFVLRERITEHPLIPLRLFRSVSLSAGVVLSVLVMFALFGVLFFLTLYLERVHGFSPVAAGVRVLPLTAVFMVSAPLAGWIMSRWGPRPPIVAGMAMIGVAFLGLAHLGVDSPYLGLWPWFVLVGFGMGFVLIGATQAIVGNAAVDEAGVASGLQQTATQLGGVLGTAVLGAVMTSVVARVLAGKLVAAGVPAAVAGRFTAAAPAVAQGIAPVSRGTPAPLAHAITHASYLSFMTGLHVAMVMGAVVAFVGAALAMAVRSGRAVEGGSAVV